MKKGFTLVEILAVITIIGVLALLTVPAIDSIIRENKKETLEVQKNQIIDSLKEYAASNALWLDDTTIITLGDLKKSGFIDKDVRNPETNECFKNSTKLKIRRQDNSFIYEIDENPIQFCTPTGTKCDC